MAVEIKVVVKGKIGRNFQVAAGAAEYLVVEIDVILFERVHYTFVQNDIFRISMAFQGSQNSKCRRKRR